MVSLYQSPPYATTGVTGLARFATTSDQQAGSNAGLAATPAAIKAAQGFTRMFESAQQTPVGDATYSLAHGLGAIPKLMIAVLVCTTAELGYAVGDEVQLPMVPWYAGSFQHTGSLRADSSNVTFIICNTITIMRRDVTGLTSINYANWRVVVRAWA